MPGSSLIFPDSVAQPFSPFQHRAHRERKALSLSITLISDTGREKDNACRCCQAVAIPDSSLFHAHLFVPSNSSFDTISFHPLQRWECCHAITGLGACTEHRRIIAIAVPAASNLRWPRCFAIDTESASGAKRPKNSQELSLERGERTTSSSAPTTVSIGDSIFSAQRPDRSVPIRRSSEPSPSHFTHRPYHPDLTKFYWMLGKHPRNPLMHLHTAKHLDRGPSITCTVIPRITAACAAPAIKFGNHR